MPAHLPAPPSRRGRRVRRGAALALAAAAACARAPRPAAPAPAAPARALRDAYRGALLVGASIGPSVFDPRSPRSDAAAAAAVGRHRGRLEGWDVVNEALEPDGSLRRSPWLAILGPGYIAEAFRAARAADPAAELYYNDHSLEHAHKRAGAVALLRRLRAERAPVTGVGTQEHQRLAAPTAAQVDSAIADLAATGLPVHVTELDVATRLDPYRAGLPDSAQRALARRYAELLAVYRRHAAALDRVTFWNAADADSWLNGWPVPGRTNHPLLFDRAARPKPAFAAVLAAAGPAAAPAARADAARLVVRRAGGDSAVFDAPALARLPRREVRAAERGRAATFAGVALADVLRAAGVRVDSVRGAALADVVVAEAADGYRVAFALGELAADLGGRDVLVADRRDGAPLAAAEGPLRLVVPGDGRPARWVRQLRALGVRRAAP